jgi:hypothetical protein
MMIVVLVNRLINSTKVSTNFNLINNYIRFVGTWTSPDPWTVSPGLIIRTSGCGVRPHPRGRVGRGVDACPSRSSAT